MPPVHGCQAASGLAAAHAIGASWSATTSWHVPDGSMCSEAASGSSRRLHQSVSTNASSGAAGVRFR